ncbi:tRNA (guanine-N1)-methyltransferase [Lutimonas zeaxanthinifaciens]|uniref:tRNA (guanine-N1)-methyltransferase n=1 Tax=Lutimonas zeaxanthinifaciens TaxID=3060215 RepID=UPI00265D1752|nr:tRNA (guanine-N1)-methyltransferase [Lutimonas sp. YSD2104]WKK67309.1 tRNA (guanine-N1)-methyltransferase [Lutimonas sp. YSD2104]
MKKFITVLSLTLFLGFGSIAYAQAQDESGPKPSLNSGTLESQFDYLYRRSSSYQEYKVVKKTFYQKIKGNVLDSLQALKKDLSDTKKLVDVQSNEINSLKADLQTTNDNLTSVTKEKDNIKFLGFPMTKSSYNSLLWTIIFSLVALLLFFIFKFRSSNAITIQARDLLSDTEKEFEAYKQKALEREQKVRRELQDELNKQKYAEKKGKK